MAIEMLFLTPGSDLFFEFREPRFLWRGALFGAEVAANDFNRHLFKPGRQNKADRAQGGVMAYVPTNILLW